MFTVSLFVCIREILYDVIWVDEVKMKNVNLSREVEKKQQSSF